MQDLSSSKFSNIVIDVSSILFPRLCFGCNVRLYRGEQILCTFCRNQMPLTEYSFNDENPIDRIFYGRIDVVKASSLLFYEDKGIVRNLIHNLKYKDQEQIGAFLGNWMGKLLKEDEGLEPVDGVVPVPLHRSKQRKRGYNQVDAFASRLAFHLGAAFKPIMLKKNRNVRTQTRKTRGFRFLGKEALYVPNESDLSSPAHLLLVDDVVTTGATLEACVRALQKVGEVRVSVATMACVP